MEKILVFTWGLIGLIFALVLVATLTSPEEETNTSAPFWDTHFPDKTLESTDDLSVADVLVSIRELPVPLSTHVELTLVLAQHRKAEEQINLDIYQQGLLQSFQTGELSVRSDKEFLLERVYVASLVDRLSPVNSDWQDFGFDYFQVVRDLYRESETLESDSIQANFMQMERVSRNL